MTTSAKACPAICAAAPATSILSGRSVRSSPTSREAPDEDARPLRRPPARAQGHVSAATRRAATPWTCRCPAFSCATARATCCLTRGCHPDVAENAEARWGSVAKVITPIMQPGDNVITALRRHRLAMRRHRCGAVLAPAFRPLRLQHLLQARYGHHARERARRPRARRMPWRPDTSPQNGSARHRPKPSTANAICSPTGASCSSPCPVIRRAPPPRWSRWKNPARSSWPPMR